MANNLYSPADSDLPKYKKLHLVCSRPTKSYFLKSHGCEKVIDNDINNEPIFVNTNDFAYPWKLKLNFFKNFLSHDSLVEVNGIVLCFKKL